MPALPVLYTFRRCPYAMRARLAIAVSAVPVELREVALRSKPAELLAASSKGTVPVLVLPGGEVIDQSLDVMRWALDQHDPRGWLQPERGALADMLALIGECDGEFKQHLDRYKYPNRYLQERGCESAPSDAGFAESHREAASVWLAELAARLTDHCALFGNRLSLADMAMLPFVRQFAHTDAAWFAGQPWPRLQQWLAHFEASDLFAAVMRARPAAWVSARQSL
jgi:glutathione S-transferase